MPAAGRTALLEIDFQNWIVDLAHDPTVVDRARAARDHWRSHGADVYCLRYLDPGPGPRGDPASHAARFARPLEPGPGEIVLSKTTNCAFDNPDLGANLALRGTTRLVLSGLMTDHGITTAAVAAHDLGYLVTVLGDATAASTAEDHHRALGRLRRRGITVA